jgi:hypothetical protein
MTIKEWEQTEIANVIRFVDKWIENNARDPDNFPLDVEPGEWDEQYNITRGLGL